MSGIPLIGPGEISDLGESVNSIVSKEAGDIVSEASEESFVGAVEEQVDETAKGAENMMEDHIGDTKEGLSPSEQEEFDKELEEVNKEIEEARDEFKKEINSKNAEVNEENLDEIKSETAKEMSLRGENTPIIETQEEQVEQKSDQNETEEPVERIDPSKVDVFIDGKWFNMDGVESETQDFFKEDFEPEFWNNFSQEDWERANAEFGEDFRAWYESHFNTAGPQVGTEAGTGNQPRVTVAPTEAAKAAEDQDARELMKLLLRIAVKISIKTAAIIAKNIAKTQMKDNPELAAAIGIFADLAEEGGKFTDTLIAGKKGESLGEDIYKYFTNKKASRASVNP